MRVTHGVHAHTHDYMAKTIEIRFNLANSDTARAVERAGGRHRSTSSNCACHIGSNVSVAESFAKAAARMAAFAAPYGLPELVLGGGLGVSGPRRVGADDHRVGGGGHRQLPGRQGSRARWHPSTRRAIVASAAITVYRVGTIKAIRACAPTSPSTAG